MTTQVAKLQKAEHKDYKSRSNSSENYDPEDFRDKLQVGEMPRRDSGIRKARPRSADVGRRKNKRCDILWPMPGLEEREGQGYGQKHAPTRQNYAGVLDLENA